MTTWKGGAGGTFQASGNVVASRQSWTAAEEPVAQPFAILYSPTACHRVVPDAARRWRQAATRARAPSRTWQREGGGRRGTEAGAWPREADCRLASRGPTPKRKQNSPAPVLRHPHPPWAMGHGPIPGRRLLTCRVAVSLHRKAGQRRQGPPRRRRPALLALELARPARPGLGELGQAHGHRTRERVPGATFAFPQGPVTAGA